MINAIKIWRAWRKMREDSAWHYYENDISGDRKAVKIMEDWDALDVNWLYRAPSGRFKTSPPLQYQLPRQLVAGEKPPEYKACLKQDGQIALIPLHRPASPPPPPPPPPPAPDRQSRRIKELAAALSAFDDLYSQKWGAEGESDASVLEGFERLVLKYQHLILKGST